MHLHQREFDRVRLLAQKYFADECMPYALRSTLFWCVIAICAVFLWELIRPGQNPAQSPPEISYSQFLSQVDAGYVASVLISGNRIEVKTRNGGGFAVNGPANQDAMIQELRQKNVDVRFKENALPQSKIATWAPLVFIAVLWLLMIWQMKLKRVAVQKNSQDSASQSENRWSS